MQRPRACCTRICRVAGNDYLNNYSHLQPIQFLSVSCQVPGPASLAAIVFLR